MQIDNYFLSQVNLFLCFIVASVISTLKYKFNLLQVLLASSLLFNFSYIFANLFGLADFPYNNLFLLGDGIDKPISNSTLTYTFSYYSFFLLYSSLGWYLTTKNKQPYYISKNSIMEQLIDTKLFTFVFFVLYVIYTLSKIGTLISAQKYGYVYVIHLNPFANYYVIPSYFFDWLYTPLSLFYLYTAKDRLSFIKRAFIILIPALFMFLAGARGLFVSLLITLIIYYNYYFQRLSLTKHLTLLLPLFLLAVFIGHIRFIDNSMDELNFLTKIIETLKGSSTSFAVLSYSIILLDDFFNHVPFILGYLAGIFSFEPNYTYEGLLHKSYLAQHLTYLLNEDKLYRGSTIGTSQVAEIFELTHGNILLFIITSFLLMIFVNFMFRLSFRSPYFFYLGFIIVSNFVLSPRNSILKLFSKEMLVFTILYAILFLCIQLIRKK